MFSFLIAYRIAFLKVNFTILNPILSSGGIVNVIKSFFNLGFGAFRGEFNYLVELPHGDIVNLIYLCLSEYFFQQKLFLKPFNRVPFFLFLDFLFSSIAGPGVAYM